MTREEAERRFDAAEDRAVALGFSVLRRVTAARRSHIEGAAVVVISLVAAMLYVTKAAFGYESWWWAIPMAFVVNAVTGVVAEAVTRNLRVARAEAVVADALFRRRGER